MIKKVTALFLIYAVGLSSVQLVAIPDCSKLKSALINGAWFIIKPFDTISDTEVTEFTLHGRQEKSMNDMQKEIKANWDSLDKFSEPDFVKFNLCTDYQPTEKSTDRFKNYHARKKAEIKKGQKKAFSIYQDVPEKKHILLYWHGTGCELKKAVIKFTHYKPYTYLASGLKWLALAAVVGTGIEEGVKLVKKARKKEKAKNDRIIIGDQDEDMVLA
jgi:hypothetical protein